MKKQTLRAGTLFILSLSGIASAQNASFRNEPLVQRIKKISDASGRNIAYNARALANLQAAGASGDVSGVESLLIQSLAGTGYTVKQLGEKDFIIVRETRQANPGRITGKIVDEAGNPVAGAEVRIGDKTITTDNNGDFSADLPAGTYTLTVNMKGFRTLRVEDLAVKPNETNSVSFVMSAAKTKVSEDSERTIKEVVIRGTRKADTQAGLLTQQKKAAQMSDGISAEQIAKTPDSDVGATLKRVTGVTTVDNKYVVVRSMGERWNTAAMDGVNMPSTDAYNNNFSFDIIPTAMVESVVVSKTATPDMNANFAGGYVEVKTKDIPNQDFLTVGMGTSFNSVSTFKEFLTKQRGKNDYFGYDSSTREFPKDLKPLGIESPESFEQSKRFKNDNFTTYKTTADPGSNYQIAFGKSFKLGKDANKFGFAGAMTLKHEEENLVIDHTSRSSYLGNIFRTKEEPAETYDFKNWGNNYSYSTILAGMLNFGVQLGKHRISFRNTYTHTFSNTLTRTTGWAEYSGSGNRAYAAEGYSFFQYGTIPQGDFELPSTYENNYPEYQTFIQNKLEGSHKLGRADIDWYVARSSADYEQKDVTESSILWRSLADEIYASHYIYNPSPSATRRNMENHTEDYNFGASVGFDLNGEKLKNKIKFGYFGAVRSNDNQVSSASLNQDGRTGDLRWFNTFKEILNDSSYQKGGLAWIYTGFFGGKYEGRVTQHAPYLMLDHRLDKWRLVWGARAEYYNYQEISRQTESELSEEDLKKFEAHDKKWQILPSANLTYSPWKNTNFRLSYYRSVIRPQFMERVGLPYYDALQMAQVFNVPGLVSSVANNYDFKFEWFPSLGEIFSIGAYHKTIDDPMERVGFVTGEGRLQLFLVNSKKAVLNGLEAEFRKSLGFISRDSFLENLYLSGNATFNTTKVTAYVSSFGRYDSDESFEVDRPLYGQTPWAYNAGLAYDGDRFGLGISHNAKGDQYINVGYDYKEEEIQRPYHTTDAVISYKMLKDKNLQFKLTAKNIFNTPIETYNNTFSYKTLNPNAQLNHVREGFTLSSDATKKYDKGIDEVLFHAKKGVTYSFSVNYTF